MLQVFPEPVRKALLPFGPLVMRPAIMLLGLIIAFIQALVFMVLSMSYIAGAVQMQEH